MRALLRRLWPGALVVALPPGEVGLGWVVRLVLRKAFTTAVPDAASGCDERLAMWAGFSPEPQGHQPASSLLCVWYSCCCGLT